MASLLQAAFAAAWEEPRLRFSRVGCNALMRGLSGDWKLKARLPAPVDVAKHLETGGPVRRLAFDVTRLGAWDSGLLTFLVGIQDLCKARNIEIDSAALPDG